METKRNKGLGIAAFVLGIIGILLSCFVIGIAFDILAVILGIISLSDKTSAKGLPIAGVSTGASGIFIALIMLIASVGNADKTDEERKKELAESQSTLENEVEQTEEMSYIRIGDFFENDGLKITINEANTDFQDYDNTYGWNTPEDGMKYVMVSFTFENNGDHDAYVSIYDFNCYADNTTCDQVYSLDDDDFMNTNLSNGRNVSFKTYYSVPIDAKSIELEYETNMWTGEKVIIKIQ